MMGGVSPETCWASHKYGIINFDTLLHLVAFSVWTKATAAIKWWCTSMYLRSYFLLLQYVLFYFFFCSGFQWHTLWLRPEVHCWDQQDGFCFVGRNSCPPQIPEYKWAVSETGKEVCHKQSRIIRKIICKRLYLLHSAPTLYIRITSIKPMVFGWWAWTHVTWRLWMQSNNFRLIAAVVMWLM